MYQADFKKIAFLAKFTQHDDLKRLLLATGDAELWHYTGTRGKNKRCSRCNTISRINDR